MLKVIIATTQEYKSETQPAVHIELPVTGETLQKAAEEIGLKDFNSGGYKIIGHSFGIYENLKNHISWDVNLSELNLLAYKFERFIDEQAKDFMSLFKDCDEVEMKELINQAYALADGFYEIWRGVKNLDDLGERFVNEKVPDLPIEIFDNIDFEGVGRDVEAHDLGAYTPHGYIRNYYEKVPMVYNGTNLQELLIQEQKKQQSAQSLAQLDKQDALIKTTIRGLTSTAVEKVRMYGLKATEDVTNLQDTVKELIRFWSLDEKPSYQFDEQIRAVIRADEGTPEFQEIYLDQQNALISTTLEGLAATAAEKACVLGTEAAGDIAVLRETAVDLVRFWSMDEELLRQFDEKVQAELEKTGLQQGPHMG